LASRIRANVNLIDTRHGRFPLAGHMLRNGLHEKPTLSRAAASDYPQHLTPLICKRVENFFRAVSNTLHEGAEDLSSGGLQRQTDGPSIWACSVRSGANSRLNQFRMDPRET